MQTTYHPKDIEATVQRYWQENNAFQVVEDANREKFYCLSMTPYPSGNLHMGHVRNYTIGDVIARYQHMLGKNVLQPISWDAFGLPAENAAIQHKIPPARWTQQNIERMREQFMSLGFAYDWSREQATCDPEYYRWEQWFFLTLYEKGLVYKKKAEVNWDPIDQTILANEQVVDGRGWRSGALVERVEIAQWFLKITAYASELLADIETLVQWPQQVKTMQRNWIGKSEGLEINFPVADSAESILIYTTRQDTLFGVTFIAVAPQHPLVKAASINNPELQQFVASCKHIKVAEADLATLEKKGIALNLSVKHPLTGALIPIWVANFVLMEYGSGALMGVPAHDERDFEFAKKYHLPIKPVINLPEESWDFTQCALTGPGKLIDSGAFTGLSSQDALVAIANHVESLGLGQKKTHYRLRDWSISRQRYWGTPIPIIYCSICGDVPVPEKDLPVILPEEVEFQGVKSPLKSMPSFLNVPCPRCGGPAQRETDTFDTFVDSSWYYARSTCKKQHKAMLDGRANYWLPVDQYVGGIEHAVMHLLYARFFHKLMRDEGLLNSDEPFTRLLTQGMVLNQGVKMSKSKGNTVDPVGLIERYGADTVRLFSMFAAPPDQALEWSESGVEGSYRFLKRLWAFAVEKQEIIKKQNRIPKTPLIDLNWPQVDNSQALALKEIYDLLDEARAYYERQQYNTVVSTCMKIFNLLGKIKEAAVDTMDIYDRILHEGMSILLRLLAPITPHITHQLWLDLGFDDIILYAPWPKSQLIPVNEATIELVVQINGKLKAKVLVDVHDERDTIENKVIHHPKVAQAIAGQTIKKIILVPGKLVNVVTEK